MEIPPLKIHFSRADIKIITSEIKDVLRSGQLSLGKMTKRFEGEFAVKTNRKFAVAVNSGTAAIEILLRVRNIKGKTVVVPTNTNYATAAAVVFAGGKLKLVDSDIITYLEDIKKTIDRKTIGIIIVHIGGYLSEELEDIKRFCDKKGLFLIEDAAHAHGASLRGIPAGCFGHAATFSFFPTKVITSGEGGMIVTDDEEEFKKILIYRDQGKDPLNKMNIVWGNSWRMSEVQAVIGFHQLKHLEEFVKRRNSIMKKYSIELEKFEKVKIYSPTDNMTPSGYKYIIQFSSPKLCHQIRKELEDEYHIHLGGGVYDIPIHQQPIFRGRNQNNNNFPRANKFCSTHLCLPIWSAMKQQEVEYVISSVKNIINKISENSAP